MTTPAAPAPKPTSTKRVLTILGITLGALLILCCGVGLIAYLAGGGEEPTTTPSGPAPAVTSPAAPVTTAPEPGLNQPVRDGQFEFKVTKIQCGVARVGSPDFGESAQGQFCLVTLMITNIGDEARSYYHGNQYAYNAAGQRYDADTDAGIYLDATSVDDLNPGLSATGMIVFDIPTTATITRLELHDSLFSGGVTVAVPAA